MTWSPIVASGRHNNCTGTRRPPASTVAAPSVTPTIRPILGRHMRYTGVAGRSASATHRMTRSVAESTARRAASDSVS